MHPRTEIGRHQTADGHIHPLKRRIADPGAAYLLKRCEQIGPGAGARALAVHRHRPIESIRVMMGLIALGRKTPFEDLDRAAVKALQRAGWKGGRQQKAIHSLRKESGSLIASTHGIEAARQHLGHRDIRTTSAHYVDKKKRIEVVIPIESAASLHAVAG